MIDEKNTTPKNSLSRTVVELLEKCASWISFLWVQAGLTLLIIILINALAGIVTRTVNHFHKPPKLEQAYNNAPWAITYFKTLRQLQVRWFPYSYWKSVPVSSPYLHVDAQGDRITWNNLRSGARPFRIFMFGGSTMWGTGVRDDATLASIAARRLTDAGKDVEVSNYGQIGYVSTQEVMLLYQLLRDGKQPDLVVFYDGINDSFAAYQNDIAGLSQNEFSRVKEFDLLSSARRRATLYLSAVGSLFYHSNIARFGRLFQRRPDAEFVKESREVVAYLAKSGPEEPAALQRQVITSYLFNKRAIQALGKEFGFRSILYWQPVTYTKNELTPYEESQLGDPSRRDFITGVYKLMAGVDKANGVRNLSDIFRDHKELIFIDTWHPNEAGNQIIGRRLADDIAREIDQITHARNETGGNPAALASRADSTARPPQPGLGKGIGKWSGALE